MQRLEYPGHEQASVFSTGPHRRYPIEDGKVVVPDEDAQHVRSVLSEQYDVDFEASSSEESDGEDEDICGTEMEDGEICRRPAGECPYHEEDVE